MAGNAFARGPFSGWAVGVTVVAVLAGWCRGTVAVETAASPAHSRPNVLVFLADDLGANDLGCTGSRFYRTPAIDRLAASGMLFTRGYAAAPVCSPTRAALMTGRHPARDLVWHDPHYANEGGRTGRPPSRRDSQHGGRASGRRCRLRIQSRSIP